MPYGIVGKRKPPKSSLEARRKYGEGKMYEQCFSIELKPWRKPFDNTMPTRFSLRPRLGFINWSSMCRTKLTLRFSSRSLSALTKKRREAGEIPRPEPQSSPKKMNEMYEQCFPMELNTKP